MRKIQFGKQCRAFCNVGAVGCAVLLTVVWFIVLGIVGSPRFLLHMLSRGGVVPPSWLFLLLAMSFYTACGLGAGSVLFERRCSNMVNAYRGAFFFSIGATLSYIWFALFFGARYLLPALVVGTLSVVCLSLTAINFRRVMTIAAGVIWIGVGIMTYFCILTIFSFFFL